MRRFLRTFLVKRHAVFAVLQDGEVGCFEVLRWRAEERRPEVLKRFSYPMPGVPYPYTLEDADADSAGLACRRIQGAQRIKAMQAAEEAAAEEAQQKRG